MLKGQAFLVAALVVASCSKEPAASGVESRTVNSADGVPIAYEVRGQGPTTLAFVHGWSCDRGHWRHQVGPFAENHRVIVLDLAGHGTSGKERSAWSIQNYANDVDAVVRDADARNVVLIGHSLGGPVALEAGRLLGDRVIGVIGVDAFFDDWADPAFTKAVDQLRPNFAAGTRAFVRQALFLPSSPAALADSISASLAAAPPEIALPSLDSLLGWARERQEPAAKALDAPVGLILVAGGRARTGRFQRSREGRSTLGVEEVPGTGHFIMLEVPDTFNSRLRAMLGRIPQ